MENKKTVISYDRENARMEVWEIWLEISGEIIPSFKVSTEGGTQERKVD